MYPMMIFFALLTLLHGEGGVLKVDWSNLNEKSLQKPRVLPQKLKKGIQDVTLPAYIPSQYLHRPNLVIVSDKNFYSVTIPLEGATLMVSGDRTYQDKFNKLELRNSTPNGVIHSNGMATLDFFKHGVSYSLAIECNRGVQDPRCGGDSFLNGIYKSLLFVGGKR
jgi:hypothetical protein